MDKTEWRNVYSKQPDHQLILDFSPPITEKCLKDVCTTLKNMVALAISIKGSPRLSLLGLCIIGEDFEPLFPLEDLRKNDSRFLSAINLVLHCFSDSNWKRSCTNGMLSKALHESFEQHEFYYQNNPGAVMDRKQLEITLITCQQPEVITPTVESLLEGINLSHLKKVQIVCIHPPTLAIEEASEEIQSGNTQSSFAGMVETLTIECFVPQLESLFKTWFFDNATDVEHLRLVFKKKGSRDLVLRCDIQERLINPDVLPYPGTYSLMTDSALTQVISSPGQGRFSRSKVPVYVLEGVKMINIIGLCESIVFGQPSLLYASHCWKLEWDELERNQQNVSALSQLLREEQMVLISKRIINDSSMPESLYVIFPAPSNSLLIKPICVQELLMPNVPSISSESLLAPSGNALKHVGAYLRELEIQQMFNPLMNPSGLYSKLVSSITNGKLRGKFGNESQTRESPNLSSEPNLENKEKKTHARKRRMKDSPSGSIKKGTKNNSFPSRL